MKEDQTVKEVGPAAHSRRVTAYLLLSLLLVGAIGFGLGTVWHPSVRPAHAAQAVPPAVTAMESTFTGVAAEVKPSVVHLSVESLPKAAEGEDSFGPLRPFLPAPPSRPTPKRGTGSGVVIDSAGYILTNVHVVAQAQQITVIMADGEEYKGKAIGTDPETDLAIVKVEPHKPLTAAILGNADEEKVASWVMAIGSPFGLDQTVTVGVISGKGRTLPRQESRDSRFRDLIQTDAAINPGNSGGPLVNLKGEVIGINQAIFSPGPFGGNVGIGFAIPLNPFTKEIIASLKQGQPVVRGLLGVYVRDLTPGMEEVYGVRKGAFVEQVAPGGSAAEAGIQQEDIIIGYEGQPVEKTDQLVAAVQRTRPGAEVEIKLIRNKQEKTVTAKIEQKKEAVAKVGRGPEEEVKGRLGLGVTELTPEIAASLGVDPRLKGVVVKSVDPAGDAARAGLEPGDIIVKVNLTPVRSIADYIQAIEKLKVGRAATIRYQRGEQIRTAVIEKVTE